MATGYYFKQDENEPNREGNQVVIVSEYSVETELTANEIAQLIIDRQSLIDTLASIRGLSAVDSPQPAEVGPRRLRQIQEAVVGSMKRVGW